MTWLAVKQFLARAWVWIRQHWELVLGIVIAVVAVLILAGRREVNFAEIIATIRERHQEELDVIDQVHQEEREAIDKAIQVKEDTLRQVEAQFEAASEQLDQKKRKEIERVIQENGNDPDAITQKIAELTGFTVVVKQDA